MKSLSTLQPIKAFVFDFDGTLAELNIDFSLMREQVFSLIRQFGIREESIQEKYLLEIIDEVSSLLWKQSPLRAKEFYENAHQILHEVEMDAAAEGKLIPGGKMVLKTLRKNGIKTGIITRNCEEAVRRVFPEINDYCDVFISRDCIAKVKPHPEHLQAVLKVLKVSEKEAVMVGDHTIDIQAGKRAGMKTIGVLSGRIKREEFEEAGADRVLKDITEICPLLEEGI